MKKLTKFYRSPDNTKHIKLVISDEIENYAYLQLYHESGQYADISIKTAENHPDFASEVGAIKSFGIETSEKEFVTMFHKFMEPILNLNKSPT